MALVKNGWSFASSAALQLADENCRGMTMMSLTGPQNSDPSSHGKSSRAASPTARPPNPPLPQSAVLAGSAGRAMAPGAGGVRQVPPSLLTAAILPARGGSSRASPSFGGKSQPPRERSSAHVRAVPESEEGRSRPGCE